MQRTCICYLTALCSLMLLVDAITPNGNFEPQCQSEHDYGWPRFHTLQELQSSPWATYFMKTYGELPNSFPVCIYDLWALDKAAFVEANITGHPIVPPTELRKGDLFKGGLTGLQIYHEDWEPLPDNTWVEVTHFVIPTELMGMWAWRQRGSGIWYNTGKTKVFRQPLNPGQVHQEAIHFLTKNCSITPSTAWPKQESDIFGFCAREKGYDSIQFEPQEGSKPIGSFGLPGLTEMVLVNIDGKYDCGVSEARKTPFRSGWMASRQCDCENHEIPATCGLMPRAPFPMSIFGTEPRICKVQEGPPFWNRWKSCDPTACLRTRCALGKRPIASTMTVGTETIGTFIV